MTILQSPSSSLGILQQQGSGWSSKPSKNKETKCKLKNCVLWQLPPSNRLANRYQLSMWEIINFRKTKYVKFIPGASCYFCVFKTGNVECDDILKAICYLLISFQAFYLSCGLKEKL